MARSRRGRARRLDELTREKLCNKGTKKHIHFAFFFCFPREQKKEKEFFSSITKGGFVISKKKASLSLSLWYGNDTKKNGKKQQAAVFLFWFGCVCFGFLSLSPPLCFFKKSFLCGKSFFVFFDHFCVSFLSLYRCP